MQITHNVQFSCTRKSNITKRKTIEILKTFVRPLAIANIWSLILDIEIRDYLMAGYFWDIKNQYENLEIDVRRRNPFECIN